MQGDKRDYGMEFNPNNAEFNTNGYDHGFLDLVAVSYGHETAQELENFYEENGMIPMNEPVETQFERAKELLPRAIPEVYATDEFDTEEVNRLAAMVDLHDDTGHFNDNTIANEIYSRAAEIEELEAGVLDYQVVDAIISGEGLEKNVYELEELTENDILRGIDEAARNPDFELKTPKHIDKYVRCNHGRGYKGVGRILDSFDSIPEELDEYRWPTRREVAQAAQEEAAVITGNEIYLRDEETDILPPDVLDSSALEQMLE